MKRYSAEQVRRRARVSSKQLAATRERDVARHAAEDGTESAAAAFATALARSRGLSLLYKGNDFARTDITPALP